MASGVYPIRASEDDRARWQSAADAKGISFNAWAREALNSQVDLDLALERLDSDFEFRPDLKQGVKPNRKRAK